MFDNSGQRSGMYEEKSEKTAVLLLDIVISMCRIKVLIKAEGYRKGSVGIARG